MNGWVDHAAPRSATRTCGSGQRQFLSDLRRAHDKNQDGIEDGVIVRSTSTDTSGPQNRNPPNCPKERGPRDPIHFQTKMDSVASRAVDVVVLMMSVAFSVDQRCIAVGSGAS